MQAFTVFKTKGTGDLLAISLMQFGKYEKNNSLL